MKTQEDDEPRPVEFVGAGGHGVPLPFTSSSARPAAPPAPEPPKRWLWLAAAGIVLVFVAALCLTARTGATHGTAAPGASAPSKSPVEVKGDLINAGLAAQAQALLGGDLGGYLASVDATLHEEFTLRFHSLRALRVARWTAQVTDMPDEADDRWTVKVTIGYCLGDPGCEPVNWCCRPRGRCGTDGRSSPMFQRTVLPWDLTALQGVAGRRVIVAAPASLAGQLQRTVEAADGRPTSPTGSPGGARRRSGTSCISPGLRSGVPGGTARRTASTAMRSGRTVSRSSPSRTDWRTCWPMSSRTW